MQPWKCHRGAWYSRDERDLLSSWNVHVTSINCSGSWDFQSKSSKNKRRVLSLWSQLQFFHGAQWGKISKVKLNYPKAFQGHSYTSQWSLVQRDLSLLQPSQLQELQSCISQAITQDRHCGRGSPGHTNTLLLSQDSCPNPHSLCWTTALDQQWPEDHPAPRCTPQGISQHEVQSKHHKGGTLP